MVRTLAEALTRLRPGHAEGPVDVILLDGFELRLQRALDSVQAGSTHAVASRKCCKRFLPAVERYNPSQRLDVDFAQGFAIGAPHVDGYDRRAVTQSCFRRAR